MVTLMPDIIQQIRDTYATDKAKALNMLPKLFKAVDDGKIIELPCNKETGAKRWCAFSGVYDCPLRNIKDAYCYESLMLGYCPRKHKPREAAEAALKERET